jgi:hypothetical protein
MPRRALLIDGNQWEVAPSGRVTQYTRDEFGVIFTRRGPTPVERRVARYSPLGTRSPEASLAELSEQQLRDLWSRSQPSRTSPETGYSA